ncbi:B-cell receptor CD22-like [Trichomycterus rosablanca]|uniref:B-cell receptor CD22-like n=1 Tax=Trichomycterus rosablanca TaxID=2290929 RepID=UPI002F35A4E2
MMMFLRMLRSASLIVLLMISGGCDAQYGWGVTYTPKSICALKGSTVILSCTYKYPPDHTVQTVFWTKQQVATGVEPPDLASDPEYRGRVQYIGDKKNDCTLKLSMVTEKDQRKYYFRFITDQPDGKYQGKDGVELHITDLQVEGPEKVIEGSEVTLRCKTTCKLTVNPTFTWYRNEQYLRTFTLPSTYSYTQLRLQSVRMEDGGHYQCAVGDHRSSAVTLNVECLQVEVPEKVKEGTDVTLRCKTTCRLTDNPTFTWYRNQQQLQTTYTYTNYYPYYYTHLRLQSVRMEDAGPYQCSVGDRRSSAVTLNVGYSPKRVSVSVSPSGEIMENSLVTLTCSSDAKPAASYQWYKGTTYKASGETFTIHKIRSDDGGEHKCQAWNEHGDQNSTAVNIDVHYPPRSVSVSVSPSGEITEGSLVTLTCSAVSNPPVENYTWYKEQTYKGSGETLTVRNISSEDGGEYKCRTSYKNQFKSSGPVAVKVLYPPKRVSVWVSSSAEPDQSGLVNLTCSADADPPVESYVWYKEGGSSAVGSGQSYGARPGESYYCRAQNKLGEQTAAARFVTSIGTPGAALYAAGGVIAGCLLAIIIIIVLIRRKKRADQANDADLNQENLYSTVTATGAENDRADPEESSQDEVQYVTIVHRSRNDPAKASGSAGTEEAQYAAIKPRRDGRAEESQQEENQYDNVRFTHRSPTSTEEDLSVIYSSVK